jgi:methyl-accepting chemotaxis protein
MMVPELDHLRQRGVHFLVGCGWLCSIAFWGLNSLFHLSADWTPILLSIGINILPTLCLVGKRYDQTVRLIIGVTAAVQPSVLVFLLRGHAWQMDMHMYFFVCLAALTVLCDWRPIAVASAVVAAHHLLLSELAPAWVFDTDPDLARVSVHAVAVILQLAVLSHITTRLRHLIVDQSLDRARSEALATEATAARTEA